MSTINLKLSGAFDGIGHNVDPEYRNVQRPTAESLATLSKLLAKNNKEYATLFEGFKHNHMPHALISHYFLGSDPVRLEKLYKEIESELDPWVDSPGEITEENWTAHLGDRKYETAYHKFFQTQLARLNGDHKALIRKYVVSEDTKLFPGLVGGLLHPLIHLGYAVEVGSGDVACEGLCLAATQYMDVFPSIRPDPQVPQTAMMAEIMSEIRDDPAFDNLLSKPRTMTTAKLIEAQPEKFNYYVNRLLIAEDPRTQVPELLHKATMLFAASHKDDDKQHDFFLLHALTSLHSAAEIIMNSNVIPTTMHQDLIKEIWAMIVGVYIIQMRPNVDVTRVERLQLLNGSMQESWEQAIKLAVYGPKSGDEHFCKVIRALMFAEVVNNDKSGFFARVAYDFATNFTKVGGYVGGSSDAHQLDIKK